MFVTDKLLLEFRETKCLIIQLNVYGPIKEEL